jgi:hypothetical protein
MPCNEADAVRSARLYGKKMAIKIKNTNKKDVPVIFFEKIIPIAKNILIIKISPFFYE